MLTGVGFPSPMRTFHSENPFRNTTLLLFPGIYLMNAQKTARGRNGTEREHTTGTASK